MNEQVSLDSSDGAVLVLGGRSEIGLALADQLVARGHRSVILAARPGADLDIAEQQLRQAGARVVTCLPFDADDTSSHESFLAGVTQSFPRLDVVVLAFGLLGDQARAELDVDHALSIIHTDYTAQVSVLTLVANLLRKQQQGEIVVFSSVAGARVRRANYVYGSAKAGLDGFATGLAAALSGSGVHLTLVRPGFVVGRMTTGMAPAPWSSTPEQVATAVMKGLDAKRDIVWVPPILRLVCVLFRALPQPIWRRLPR